MTAVRVSAQTRELVAGYSDDALANLLTHDNPAFVKAAQDEYEKRAEAARAIALEAERAELVASLGDYINEGFYLESLGATVSYVDFLAFATMRGVKDWYELPENTLVHRLTAEIKALAAIIGLNLEANALKETIANL